MRSASIELIIDCSGAEQWSEHFTFSQSLNFHRLSSVRAPLCRLLAAADCYFTFSLIYTQRRRPWRTLRTWPALPRPIRNAMPMISYSLSENSSCATTSTALSSTTLKNSFVLFAVLTATKHKPSALLMLTGKAIRPLLAEVAANV